MLDVKKNSSSLRARARTYKVIVWQNGILFDFAVKLTVNPILEFVKKITVHQKRVVHVC